MSEQAQSGFFSGQPVVDLFSNATALAPSTTMHASSQPRPWPIGDPITLPSTYEFLGEQCLTDELIADTDTAALLVLHDGAVRYEQYWLTGGQDVRWLSMSVAKSFISAMVGIAVGEGKIGSIDQPISDYIVTTPGSAYDGVAIRDVLEMSSGARWNEDYSDPDSEIFQLSAALRGPGTLDEFVANATAESEPGTVCQYNSADTQALGALLVAATGRSITDYMTDKLVEPLGMELASHWLTDSMGREAAYFGLTMAARDFARLGELYRLGGRCGDRQVVPADYVAASIRPNQPHTQPGRVWVGDHEWGLGYGYQWWIPGIDSEFTAIGVYNQFVFVHPDTGVVIVKLSANQMYGTADTEEVNRELENLAMLRAIALSVGQE